MVPQKGWDQSLTHSMHALALRVNVKLTIEGAKRSGICREIGGSCCFLFSASLSSSVRELCA